MIPRILHYCWFGTKPMDSRMRRWMDGWEKVCPGFTVMHWDERNSPIEANDYVRQAFEAKKWAFVADYVRLWALWEHGGIYVDTDVELLQSLDSLLVFSGVMGFESAERIGTAFIAAKPRHALIGKLLEDYDHIPFALEDGSFDETTNVKRITQECVRRGLRLDGTRQSVSDMEIFPQEWFSPMDLTTGKLCVTQDSCAIHHFNASWMSASQRRNTKLAQMLGPRWTARIKGWLGR